MSVDHAWIQQILAAQQGGGSVARLLADHEDPTVRAVAQMIATREAADALEAEEAAGTDGDSPAPEPRLAPEERARLEARIDRLSTEVRRLRRVNDVLAAALGACPVCWGEAPDCEVCEGGGAPGWEEPERRLFLRLVRPALAHVRPLSETATRRRGHLAEVAPMPDRTTETERRDP